MSGQRSPYTRGMTELQHNVRIACSRGTIELPRRSRDALVERIRNELVDDVLDAFETSGIVKLGAPGARLVVDVIDKWARAVGAPRLPAGVWGLRNALADDLD
jgi:hypothetical protein